MQRFGEVQEEKGAGERRETENIKAVVECDVAQGTHAAGICWGWRKSIEQ